MKIWFPEYYTEAHRTPERKADLVSEMRRVGIDPVLDPEQGCKLCFCGSIFIAEHVRRHNKGFPVIHYNWDLYPAVINNGGDKWRQYLKDLKECRKILVPGNGTAMRTIEYTGKSSEIVLAPVKVWDIPESNDLGDNVKSVRHPRSYYLDVMRDYPWDSNYTLVRRACRLLRQDLVQTKTTRPWNEFRYLVANAKCLLSCCLEASTGGLTLLEGYAHGIPVITCGNELNGVREYFGDRATYFMGTGLDSLMIAMKIRQSELDPVECRKWVEDNHSDRVFAQRLRECFDQCIL